MASAIPQAISPDDLMGDWAARFSPWLRPESFRKSNPATRDHGRQDQTPRTPRGSVDESRMSTEIAWRAAQWWVSEMSSLKAPRKSCSWQCEMPDGGSLTISGSAQRDGWHFQISGSLRLMGEWGHATREELVRILSSLLGEPVAISLRLSSQDRKL